MTFQLKVPDITCPKGHCPHSRINTLVLKDIVPLWYNASHMVYRFAYDACTISIAQAVQSIDLTAQVQSNLKTKQVTIETQASESIIREAIAAAGYSPA